MSGFGPAKCVICGALCGRGRTCSGACRAKLSRSMAKAHDKAHAPEAHAEPDLNKADIDEIVETLTTPTMHERQCQANNEGRSKADQHTINTGPAKSFDKLDKGEHNRVALPFDDDYEGIVGSELVLAEIT